MKSSTYLQVMLKNAGVSRFLLTGREKKVLQTFLKIDELIEGCAKGYYAQGKGVLIVTNQRIILLDSRLLSMYSRVIEYDVVSDIKFVYKLFDSMLLFRVNNKPFVFKAYSERHLGRLASYLRGKVLSLQSSGTSVDYSSFLDQSDFELSSRVLIPRHRHGKFPVTLH